MPYGCGGAQAIWIPLTVAERAVKVVLCKSPSSIIDDAIEVTRKLAVDCKDRLTDEDAEKYCTVMENTDEIFVENENASLDESSIDSAGIEKKKEEIVVKKLCVNLFLWLRHIMDFYEKESSHRKASIRLMFETASSGALTDDVPVGLGSTICGA